MTSYFKNLIQAKIRGIGVIQPRPQSVFEPLVLRYNDMRGIQGYQNHVPNIPVEDGGKGLKKAHIPDKVDIPRSAQAGVRLVSGTHDTGAARRTSVVPIGTVVPFERVPEPKEPIIYKDSAKSNHPHEYTIKKPQRPIVAAERPVPLPPGSSPAPDTVPEFPVSKLPAGKQRIPRSGSRLSWHAVPEPEMATVPDDILPIPDGHHPIPATVSPHEWDVLPVGGISRKSHQGRDPPLHAAGREFPGESSRHAPPPAHEYDQVGTPPYQNAGLKLPAVRVTIGRIEVRAVTPPQPVPQTVNRPPVPRMSLQEYLKNRTSDMS